MTHECPLCGGETDATEDRTALADLPEEEVLCKTCQGAVSAVNESIVGNHLEETGGQQ